MADVTRQARRGRRRAEEQASDRASDVEETAGQAQDAGTEQAQQAGAQAQEAGESVREGADSARTKVTSELADTVREAALEVLRPVARKATESAAKYAVTKGPDLVKDRVLPKVEEAGGAGAIAKGALSKGGAVGGAAGGIVSKVAGKAGGGKKPTGHGRGRRLPVQEYVDVAADIETVYDQYTQFEDWPQFMHRVEKIEQRDDTTLMWHENIWGIRRSWEAEIVEQVPCERIVWRSKGQTETVGVVTFHRLSDKLTRVQVNMDFQPKGLFEKTASGLRMSRRALKSDLMRFKAWVEMRDEATGEWRGRIEEGEVVGAGEEEGGEEQEREEGEPRAEEEEEGYEEEEEEYAEEEEREPAAEGEEEEEEEEAEERPRAGRFARDGGGEEESYSDEDEEDVEEAEAEEPPRPRRRQARRRTAASSPRSSSGGRRR